MNALAIGGPASVEQRRECTALLQGSLSPSHLLPTFAMCERRIDFCCKVSILSRFSARDVGFFSSVFEACKIAHKSNSRVASPPENGIRHTAERDRSKALRVYGEAALMARSLVVAGNGSIC